MRRLTLIVALHDSSSSRSNHSPEALTRYANKRTRSTAVMSPPAANGPMSANGMARSAAVLDVASQGWLAGRYL
jgi:hypothetical protein